MYNSLKVNDKMVVSKYIRELSHRHDRYDGLKHTFIWILKCADAALSCNIKLLCVVLKLGIERLA